MRLGKMGGIVTAVSQKTLSYQTSYWVRPLQGAGSASGVKRTHNVQTLTHPCHVTSAISI